MVNMVMWFASVIWRGSFFIMKILQKAAQKPHNFIFFIYTSGKNGDHEWCKMTNSFILCDLLWKVQKSHSKNREDGFNYRSEITIVQRFISPKLDYGNAWLVCSQCCGMYCSWTQLYPLLCNYIGSQWQKYYF